MALTKVQVKQLKALDHSPNCWAAIVKVKDMQNCTANLCGCHVASAFKELYTRLKPSALVDDSTSTPRTGQ